MHETLHNREKHLEDSEGLRKLLMLVGLNHIAEVVQKLPQTTYESITSVVRSALDRLLPNYQQIAWSLVVATALTACAGIEDASAQTKDNTIDQPGKPTLLTPIATPTTIREDTTTPTRQVLPHATATPKPTATVEAQKPTEAPVRKQVVEVPAGVNVRQDHSTTAAIEFTSQGVTLEATGEEYNDGTYTWYEVINPEEPPKTVWVASVNGVVLKEVTVTSGTGGPAETDQETTSPELSSSQELDKVSEILSTEVSEIEINGLTQVAKNSDGVIVGTKVGTGEWRSVDLPSIETTTDETEAENKSEIEIVQEFSYQEAQKQFPELMAQIPAQLIDVQASKAANRAIFSPVKPSVMRYQYDGVNLTMVDTEGSAIIRSVSGNKDETLNGWAEIKFNTEHYTIELGTNYNNLDQDPNFESRKVTYKGHRIPYFVEIIPNTPEILTGIPKQAQYYINDQSMVQWFIEQSLLDHSSPITELPDPGSTFDEIFRIFLDGIRNKTGNYQIPVEDNDTTVIKTVDPNLPIRIIVNRFPGREGWLNKKGLTTPKPTGLPKQYYDVVNGQLTIWTLSRDAVGYTVGTDILYALDGIWSKVGIAGDAALTASDKNSMGIELHPQLTDKYMTYFTDGNSNYLLSPFVISSADINDQDSNLVLE